MSKVFAVCALTAVGLICATIRHFQQSRDDKTKKRLHPPPVGVDGAQDLIGNTPMIRLPRLSAALNCHVLVKCEFMNPGGSPKDRVALSILDKHDSAPEDNKKTVYEGTVGSTGISLAWLSRAKGFNCHIVIPDDQSQEKYALLEKLGAEVEKVRPVGIVDENHFCRLAGKRAMDDPNGIFADQFENEANNQAHYTRTGPEIYEQLMGWKWRTGLSTASETYLVLGAGTGGTLAGCTKYLKPRMKNLRIILADPPGSGLANKVRHNLFFSSKEAEGTRRRHQVDTVVEGVGINRMTANLKKVLETTCDDGMPWIDDAITVTDRECACMARYMVDQEGLFLGSSSCVNLVAFVKLARGLTSKSPNQEHTMITILPDSGHRHLTKFWSDEYLVDNGILSIEEVKSKEFRAQLASLEFVQ